MTTPRRMAVAATFPDSRSRSKAGLRRRKDPDQKSRSATASRFLGRERGYDRIGVEVVMSSIIQLPDAGGCIEPTTTSYVAHPYLSHHGEVAFARPHDTSHRLRSLACASMQKSGSGRDRDFWSGSFLRRSLLFDRDRESGNRCGHRHPSGVVIASFGLGGNDNCAVPWHVRVVSECGWQDSLDFEVHPCRNCLRLVFALIGVCASTLETTCSYLHCLHYAGGGSWFRGCSSLCCAVWRCTWICRVNVFERNTRSQFGCPDTRDGCLRSPFRSFSKGTEAKGDGGPNAAPSDSHRGVPAGAAIGCT